MIQKTTLTLLIFLSLSACKNYQFSVNDNVLYTPPSLFKNYAISDVNLLACVQQTIQDNAITKAEDLTALNCSSAKISSLNGLHTFYKLKQLKQQGTKLYFVEGNHDFNMGPYFTEDLECTVIPEQQLVKVGNQNIVIDRAPQHFTQNVSG